MGVPKRKPSRSRQRMRRAYNSVLKLPQLSTCPQCAAPYMPHRVCPACGFYKGRQVISAAATASFSEKRGPHSTACAFSIMRIAVDAMGGDSGCGVVIDGVKLALE